MSQSLQGRDTKSGGEGRIRQLRVVLKGQTASSMKGTPHQCGQGQKDEHANNETAENQRPQVSRAHRLLCPRRTQSCRVLPTPARGLGNDQGQCDDDQLNNGQHRGAAKIQELRGEHVDLGLDGCQFGATQNQHNSKGSCAIQKDQRGSGGDRGKERRKGNAQENSAWRSPQTGGNLSGTFI